MKHISVLVFVISLFFAFGITGTDAQQTTQDECTLPASCQVAEMSGMVQDDPPPGMKAMADMHPMGMMAHMSMMPDNMMMARHHVMMMLMSLGLDQKQQEAVSRIISASTKEMIKKRADLLIAMMELEDIVHKEPLDMTAAEAKLKYVESMRTAMLLTHLRAVQEIKSVLTPDQIIKLNAIMTGQMDGGMKMMKHHQMKKEKKSGPADK
jgi:Spy/CpxP family protein refolding chaperone